MKSYEEMTASVLTRGKKERQVQRKRRSIALAAIMGLCCLCLSVIGIQWLKTSAGQTPEQTLHRQPRVGFAIRCSAAEAKPAELIKDVIIPCEMMLRVRDVTGMDETERKNVCSQEQAAANEVFSDRERTATSLMQWSSETAVITLFWIGELELMIDNDNEVESTSVVATEMGLSNLDYVDAHKGDERLSIFLGFSDAAIEMIENDPGIALSTLNYSLTVKVRFKDGTTETAVIDIIIDDNGYMYAQQKGIVVTA